MYFLRTGGSIEYVCSVTKSIFPQSMTFLDFLGLCFGGWVLCVQWYFLNSSFSLCLKSILETK